MRGHTNYERETDALAFGAQPIGRYSTNCHRTFGNYNQGSHKSYISYKKSYEILNFNQKFYISYIYQNNIFLQNLQNLQTHCPNLILLDLSNVSTVAISHGILLIEKLQQGCQKLKVLRITNSHITLGPATLQEQVSRVLKNHRSPTNSSYYLFVYHIDGLARLSRSRRTFDCIVD